MEYHNLDVKRAVKHRFGLREIVMPSTTCYCGHWNYDHRNTTDECDVGYCECKMFELDPDEDSVENPWEGDDGE
tara:strand:+ start:1484 stop:1705 length:222 start_codon:yes stop_codon:yes gene_type:complete